MNKTLLWLLIALGAVLILGSGLSYYFLIYKPKKSTNTNNANTNTAQVNENTNVSNANANNANKNSNTSDESSIATVKSVHCLQNPAQGSEIKITNLTAYSTQKSPLSFTGTANAFENTFSYRLKDCRGPVLDEGSITAEGEAYANAPYSKTITFTLSRSPMDAILEVYEISQADGSETNLYQMPLRLIK